MTSLSRTLAIVSGVSVSLGAGSAFADEGTLSERLPAVTNALEIAVGGGYSQGVGDVGKGMGSVDDLTGPGGGAELKVGYRLIPNLAFGAFGSLSGFSTGDQVDGSTDVLGATAGIFADWHFLPAETIDPWLSLSTCWRGLRLTRGGVKDTSLQGLEIAKLQAGVDYRITPEVAIAPVIGASMSMYLAQKSPGSEGYDEIDNPELNVYFFGGVQGRFDTLGRTVK